MERYRLLPLSRALRNTFYAVFAVFTDDLALTFSCLCPGLLVLCFKHSDISFFCEAAELLRSEQWSIFTNNGVRYAAVFEMPLHFPDGRKCLFIVEFVDSPVAKQVIDGDQVVAAVVHKDVCANFLREFWQLMAHQAFLLLRDILRAAGLAEGNEFLRLSVHFWSEDSLSSSLEAPFSAGVLAAYLALYLSPWTLE